MHRWKEKISDILETRNAKS